MNLLYEKNINNYADVLLALVPHLPTNDEEPVTENISKLNKLMYIQYLSHGQSSKMFIMVNHLKVSLTL